MSSDIQEHVFVCPNMGCLQLDRGSGYPQNILYCCKCPSWNLSAQYPHVYVSCQVILLRDSADIAEQIYMGRKAGLSSIGTTS